MAIVRYDADGDVVEYAKKRIINTFSNGVPVYLSMSGGKDSIVLSHLVYELCATGQVDKDLLTVIFIDEEAIFDDVEKIVLNWRKKWLLIGVKFDWYCAEFKHFNCFNNLTSDESFITFDRYKEEVWVRKPPKFAIRNHPLLKPRQQTYQEFLNVATGDGISIIGIRAAESLMRLEALASSFTKKGDKAKSLNVYPIYDWKDNDIWLYIKERQLEYPITYLYLWQSGENRRNMRLSQFFSIDTARILVKLGEFYPDLMQRVNRREPNAYIATMYWDTEMFRRSSSSRKNTEKNEKPKDYDEEIKKIFKNFNEHFDTKNKIAYGKQYRNLYMNYGGIMSEKHKKIIYESLVAGDPKQRSYRGLVKSVFNDYHKTIDKNTRGKK